MSGYGTDALGDTGLLDGGGETAGATAFIAKPFQIRELAARVRAILDA
jgi:hypothetical protein